MDAKSVNKQLKDLYDKWLNNYLANKYDIKKYTYPVLMKCNSKYCNSQTKILFIAQEKKDWLSGNDGYKQLSEDKVVFNIETLMEQYGKFNDKFTDKANPTDYFEKIMVKISQAINSKFDCLWTSVTKIDRKSKNYPDRKELHYCEDINLSILVREIECANPDVIVYATGTSNNNDISTIKNIVGRDTLFIPIKEDKQISLVTKQNIGKLVVRIPDFSWSANSLSQTLSTLIKNNIYAYSYPTNKFQDSQIYRY
jgi:hypothetical protein